MGVSVGGFSDVGVEDANGTDVRLGKGGDLLEGPGMGEGCGWEDERVGALSLSEFDWELTFEVEVANFGRGGNFSSKMRWQYSRAETRDL